MITGDVTQIDLPEQPPLRPDRGRPHPAPRGGDLVLLLHRGGRRPPPAGAGGDQGLRPGAQPRACHLWSARGRASGDRRSPRRSPPRRSPAAPGEPPKGLRSRARPGRRSVPVTVLVRGTAGALLRAGDDPPGGQPVARGADGAGAASFQRHPGVHRRRGDPPAEPRLPQARSGHRRAQLPPAGAGGRGRSRRATASSWGTSSSRSRPRSGARPAGSCCPSWSAWRSTGFATCSATITSAPAAGEGDVRAGTKTAPASLRRGPVVEFGLRRASAPHPVRPDQRSTAMRSTFLALVLTIGLAGVAAAEDKAARPARAGR